MDAAVGDAMAFLRPLLLRHRPDGGIVHRCPRAASFARAPSSACSFVSRELWAAARSRQREIHKQTTNTHKYPQIPTNNR
eukprot:1819031-Prymnesium_polylepis.1